MTVHAKTESLEVMFIMAALALPVDICALGRIVYFGVKRKINLQETITLMMIELNSIFIWICNLYFFFHTTDK